MSLTKKNDFKFFKLDNIKRIGGYVSDYIYPPKKLFRYTKKVYIGLSRFTGRPVGLDLTQSQRIFIYAQTGAGKTYLTRAICDRAFKAKIIPIILTDLKGEYYTSTEPNTDDFKLLLENEVPTGLPMNIYYPKFFKYFTDSELDFEYYPFTLSLSNMLPTDFMTILSSNLSDSQRNLIEEVFSNNITLEEMIENIKELKGYNSSVKNSIISSIKNLIKYEVIGDDYHSFVEDVKNNVIPVLCLAGRDRIGENYSFYISAYIAIILREITDALRANKIKKKVLVVIEEAPSFIKEGSLSGQQIEEAYRIGRLYGMSIILDSQVLTDSIFNRFIGNSRYILVPKNIDLEPLAQIFKRFGLIDSSPYMLKSDVNSIRTGMKTYKEGGMDWILIDKDKSSYEIFRPLSTLSQHYHESE